jgi:hypothetical protein
MRWLFVAAYAFGAFLAFLGGMTAGEFVGLLVVGAVLSVANLTADWINNAPRRDDE